MDRDGIVPRASRLTAVVYIVGAIFGLIISIGGLVSLWVTKDEVTGQVQEVVDLTGRTLEASSGTVEVAGKVLERTAENLALAHQMIDDLSDTVDNSGNMLDSTADLVGEDMVTFVSDTQTSLDSLQTSAKLVDDFLRLLNNVPFMGGRYQPGVPLQEGFARMERSMDPLEETFTQLRSDLDRASASADTFKVQLDELNEQVDAIQTDLETAQGIVAEYDGILDSAHQRYERFARRLPLMTNVVYLGITALLLWMLMTQTAMLLHGLEMFR